MRSEDAGGEEVKILVTGSSGYIGSWLVPKLLADGHEVVGVDTDWFGSAKVDNDKFQFIRCDVGSLLSKAADVDAAIHLAMVSNNAMLEKDYALFTADRLMTLGFMRLVKKVPFVIYASSVAVYGSTTKPATEDVFPKPTTRYGQSKKDGEYEAMNIGACIVRSASVVGRSANMRFDITLNKMTHDAARNGVIKVNGGDQKRCHVTLDDLCDFYRLLLAKKPKGETFNVVAENQSVRDSAEMVAEATGAGIEYGPATDKRSYTASGAKAERFLGWKPKGSIKDEVFIMATMLKGGYWKDSAAPRYWRMADALA